MSRKTKERPKSTCDCVVVGGGLAGLVAACATAKAGLDVIHLAPAAPPDHRTSALMVPSVKILADLGLVDDPNALGEPLRKIRIIDATSRLVRAPEALFDSAEVNEQAFGWNFANAAMSTQFSQHVEALPNLNRLEASATGLTRVESGWMLALSDGRSIKTSLVVGADGKRSFVREAAGISINETRHKQSALVCDLKLSFPLNGESVEFHYENGPFTLVPAGGQRANLVWIEGVERLAEIKALAPEAILAAIQERSQNLFGKLELETPAVVFPLSSFEADTMGKEGIVLVGESAHAFPPIGAQGLNLSLRDVAGLVGCVNKARLTRPDWATGVSKAYSGVRKADVRRTNMMVGGLFKSLLSGLLPAQALRAGGVWALKKLPPLRKSAFRLGMGPG